MDTKKIKQIIDLFEDSKLASMDLEVDDIKIKMTRESIGQSTVITPSIQNVNTEELIEVKEEEYLTSPLVGTFYSSNTQGGKALVEVGQRVNKGDVVCVIEAMKVMNEIKADKDGVIEKVMVEDGNLVEFNQPLFVVGK